MAHGLGLSGSGQQRGGAGDQIGIAIRHGIVQRIVATDPRRGGGREHHRQGHRHRLKHLVLHPARQFERHQSEVGGGQPVADVIDRAPDMDAVLAVLREQFCGRIAANDVEAGLGELSAQCRQQALNHAKCCGDIGGIVHLSGENDPGAVASQHLRRGLAQRGIEQLAIDPIAQGTDIAGVAALRAEPRAEQCGLLV